MGEKIKNLAEFSIGKERVYIELNEGYSPSYSKYDIHIQSEHLQYYLSNKDFMNLATTLITAKNRLSSMKQVENINEKQSL